MKTNYVNYVCFVLLITLFAAVVSTIPAAIKAKQTISSGIQASTQYHDADAIDYGNEEVTNPFKEKLGD